MTSSTEERWTWYCEQARCGSDIGTKENMQAIADAHRAASGHLTNVGPFLPPSFLGPDNEEP